MHMYQAKRANGATGSLVSVLTGVLPQHAAVLALVVVLHALALYAFWASTLLPPASAASTLFVNFIAPPAPPKAEEPTRVPEPPKPNPLEKPAPQFVAQTPALEPADYVAPAPPAILAPAQSPEPVHEAAKPASLPLPLPLPSGPVAMAEELSVACTERARPDYPQQSQRLGETGTVVLRVEIDEKGNVADARVSNSSGFARLDAAALAAVRRWRCTPASRNGQNVRAIAQQPFKFVIQGN
jgi:protein TonB